MTFSFGMRFLRGCFSWCFTLSNIFLSWFSNISWINNGEFYFSPRMECQSIVTLLASIFSLQYHPWIKHESHKNRRDDHQLKQLLIVKQILLVSLFGNVWRTVWRICILGVKGFNPWGWLASNFSLQYHPWIKCKGHEIMGNDLQFTKLPNVKQIDFLVTPYFL